MNNMIRTMIRCPFLNSDGHQTHFDGHEVLPKGKQVNVTFYCNDCGYNFSKSIHYENESIIPKFIKELREAAPPIPYESRKYVEIR